MRSVASLRLSEQEVVQQVRQLYCQIVEDESALKSAQANIDLYAELERVTKIYVAEKTALASLPNASTVPAIRLPLTALVRHDSRSAYAVFILQTEQGRSTVHLQAVEVGPVEGNAVVIRSGLRPGLKVVLDGNNDLVDGETVSEVPGA